MKFGIGLAFVIDHNHIGMIKTNDQFTQFVMIMYIKFSNISLISLWSIEKDKK